MLAMLNLAIKFRAGLAQTSRLFSRPLATLPFDAVPVGDDDGITYQNDVTIENVGEIVQAFSSDLNMGQAHVFSDNNLRAMTIASERPWTTARNKEGKVIGCTLATRCGDSIMRSTGVYIYPDYRGRDIAYKMYHYSLRDSLTQYPLGGCQHIVRDGAHMTIKAFPHEKLDERMVARIGVPDKYDAKQLPSEVAGVKIVPFERGLLFDKLVYWDTARVHWIPRQEFLKALLSPGVVTTYVALDDKTQEVVGYACIQFAINPKSHIVGPLYGENDEISLLLLHKIMEHYVPGNNVAMMHYEKNKVIGKVFDQMGVPVRVFAESRYTNDKYRLPERFKSQTYLIANCGTLFC